MRYFQKLMKRLKERDSKGFTIIEAAVTIPMLALVGGTLFMLMANSVTIIHNNSIATAAGGEVRVIMNEAREAKNCYQLDELTKASPKEIGMEKSSSFTITSSMKDLCESGQAATFKTEAIRDKDSQVLFTSTTKIYISE